MSEAENFDDLNINEDILRGVYAYGFEKPSAIQSQAIPTVIEGKDIIAQAQSGTGKTGAFAISTLCRIDPKLKRTQSLILAPTHELADQIFTVIKEISNYSEISILKVVGKTSVNQCARDLSTDPQVIVGTPGRVLDMIQKNYLHTDSLKMLIFDEADEILSYCFKDNIYHIVQTIPKETQICLFSATLPPEVLELTDKFMKDPIQILVKKEQLTLEGIQQFYVNVKHSDWKYDVIADLYDIINVGQCIVYINNKSKIVEINDRLLRDNFPVSYITGDKTSEERNKIMEDFRGGKIRILLSTDLLARGIDIQQLSLVINYDLPREKETYIHRIGRSGRYGRKGVAINFITERDIEELKFIESFYDTKINEMPGNIADYLN
jgi:translation initiation factor 4A